MIVTTIILLKLNCWKQSLLKFCTMKSKAQLLFGIFCLLWMGATAATPSTTVYQRIVGFEAIPNPITGVYTFCPTCKDRHGRESHPCSEAELRPFLLEWHFGDGDYSVAPKPTRQFTRPSAEPSTEVRLRITGLKEERVGRCIAAEFVDDCRDTIRASIAAASWVIFPEFVEVIRNIPGEKPIIATEFVDSFPNPNTIGVAIAPPYCKPTWGAEVIYPVVFYNPTDCDYEISNASIRHWLLMPLTKDWIPYELGCEDFIPSGNVRCEEYVTRGPIAPSIGAAAGSLTRKGASSLIESQLQFIVPARSSRVILMALQFPESLGSLDLPRHRVAVNATWTRIPSKSIAAQSIGLQFSKSQPADSCPDSLVLSRIRLDTLVTSIDPNKKWIENPKAVYYDGDKITFVIKFMNTGTADEHLVYVRDLLPPMLDRHIDFLGCTLAGPNRRMPAAFNSPTSSDIVDLNGRYLYKMDFVSEAAALTTHPGDSGIVRFSVLVKTGENSNWLPSIFVKVDTILDTLSNTGYTVFSGEGIVHASDPVQYVVARPTISLNGAFWGLIILLASGIVLLILWVLRRGSGLKTSAPDAQRTAPVDTDKKEAACPSPVTGYATSDASIS
jgi:uncharacterized repeat protein (TIGR01451 family)